MGVFDSLNEASGCTDYKAKKPQLFAMYRCWKNQEKTQKITPFCNLALHLSYQTTQYDDFPFFG